MLTLQASTIRDAEGSQPTNIVDLFGPAAVPDVASYDFANAGCLEAPVVLGTAELQSNDLRESPMRRSDGRCFLPSKSSCL